MKGNINLGLDVAIEIDSKPALVAKWVTIANTRQIPLQQYSPYLTLGVAYEVLWCDEGILRILNDEGSVITITTFCQCTHLPHGAYWLPVSEDFLKRYVDSLSQGEG